MRVNRKVNEDSNTARSLFKNGLLLLVFLFAVISVARGVIRLANSGQKIEQAHKQLENVKKDQESLKNELGMVESDFYRQKEARDKLGLARSGETVIVLPNEEILRRLSPRKADSQVENQKEPNWKKWANLFFDI